MHIQSETPNIRNTFMYMYIVTGKQKYSASCYISAVTFTVYAILTLKSQHVQWSISTLLATHIYVLHTESL